MSTEANKAIVVQLYEEVWNRGDLDLADKLVAPNAIDHEPQRPPGGPQGLKAVVTMLRAAFPDDHHTIEDLIAEGDKVVARLTHSGTHQGAFLDLPPTGKHVSDTSIHIFRFADGQLVEHWAKQPFPANGSATTLKSTTTATQQEGSNKIVSQTQQGAITGDIMGSYTNEETLTLAADNSGTFSGTITCTCTVTGKSGTLIWSYTGTQTTDGSFQGQVFNLQGTGDLAGLHGQGVFQGQGDHLTYSCDLHFDT